MKKYFTIIEANNKEEALAAFMRENTVKNLTPDGTSDKTGSKPIIINKPVQQEEIKHISYYLRESTVDLIKKLAKESNMGISEFLQNVLDNTLDKIKIKG